MKQVLTYFLFVFSLLALPPQIVEAQDVKTEKIELVAKNESLPQVFRKLEKKSNYKVNYVTKDLEGLRFTGTVHATSIREAMKQILRNLPLTFTVDGQFITITKKKVEKPEQQSLDHPRQEPIKVQGKVVDENGTPLPGVTVKIHAGKTGVMSDLDGHYNIKAQPDDVLTFSFIGYKTEQVPIKGKTQLSVRLEPESSNLDEVTVVAFGSQKKESVVSSITSVNAKDLKTSSSDLTTSFAGKIPGMIAWQTGGLVGSLTEEEMNTKFYVRGITSFQSSANSDPLILIDGVESSKLELSRLVVEDIESFSVLKDASATAMYGARGANGVILVTTKKR